MTRIAKSRTESLIKNHLFMFRLSSEANGLLFIFIFLSRQIRFSSSVLQHTLWLFFLQHDNLKRSCGLCPWGVCYAMCIGLGLLFSRRH